MPKVDERHAEVAHKDIFLMDISVEHARTMNGL
jgi:hypothetical protein